MRKKNITRSPGIIISEKAKSYFNALREENEDRYQTEFKRFDNVNTYYKTLQYINYSGEWGDTLYDFFCPEDENADYSEKNAFFAPFAAALSPTDSVRRWSFFHSIHS